MPSGPHLRKNTDYALVVEGLRPLQRALKRTEGHLDTFVRARLKAIAEPIRTRARANITHTTGRHGDPNLPHLADTLKIGATMNALSVYSNQPYSGIQDRGGRLGKGAILPRAKASGYLSKAVAGAQADTTAALERLGAEIEAEIER